MHFLGIFTLFCTIVHICSPCYAPLSRPFTPFFTLPTPAAHRVPCRARPGLFTYSEDARCHWFRPGGAPSEREPQYTLAGLILGLAIYNSVTLDVRLPAVAYRKLAGRRGGLEDLDQISPVREGRGDAPHAQGAQG